MKAIKLFLLFVLSFMPIMVDAQDELEILSFTTSPNEIISKKNQVRDGNGDFCALVKVQVVDNINHVEGNVIGDVVKKGSEKWIYMTQGTKFFTIHFQNHLPVKINSKDYGIPELKSKQVYVLRLKDNASRIVKDTVVVEREREVEKVVIKEGKTRFNVYIQPAVQAGTLMGFGGNIGLFVSNFNVEAYVTSTMQKESIGITSGGSTINTELSGLIIGGKVGYDIKLTDALHITPQVGLGSLSIKGDDLSTSVMCATVGARLEYCFTPNLGVSLTPEGQFAISKQDIYEQLTNASSKIKGWGTGGNIRLGLFFKF